MLQIILLAIPTPPLTWVPEPPTPVCVGVALDTDVHNRIAAIEVFAQRPQTGAIGTIALAPYDEPFMSAVAQLSGENIDDIHPLDECYFDFESVDTDARRARHESRFEQPLRACPTSCREALEAYGRRMYKAVLNCFPKGDNHAFVAAPTMSVLAMGAGSVSSKGKDYEKFLDADPRSYIGCVLTLSSRDYSVANVRHVVSDA